MDLFSTKENITCICLTNLQLWFEHMKTNNLSQKVTYLWKLICSVLYQLMSRAVTTPCLGPIEPRFKVIIYPSSMFQTLYQFYTFLYFLCIFSRTSLNQFNEKRWSTDKGNLEKTKKENTCTWMIEKMRLYSLEDQSDY